MNKLIEQAIKNCKINKYEKYFEQVCKEYKRLLDEESKQLNLPPVINWVACTDKLPEDRNFVLVRDNIGQYDIGNYYNNEWHTETPMVNNGITHWMPIKPPCL
jgi:hypothetical protein